ILYEILYNMDSPFEQKSPEVRVPRHGKGLSLNVSSGGMLLLMDHQPKVNQAMKVHVPTPINVAETPTLAEVRWTRKLPFRTFFDSTYFVGVKFVLSET
ncbi:MAG TPA: PilZ domain-containing protein, partial [Nitrospiraceae bacterium]|nr:PilZ domain-containing protein [Nitrospiraceae bacterium]